MAQPHGTQQATTQQARTPMTLPMMIRQSSEKYKGRVCMMVTGPEGYSDVSWEEFYSKVERLATALTAMGVKPGDRVAILSHTRMEWALADTAALTAGAITVPIYPSLEAEEIKELLTRAGAKVLFLSDAEQMQKTQCLSNMLGFLDMVIAFEDGALECAASNAAEGQLASLSAIIEETSPDPGVLEKTLASRTEDDVATIIYTSGTTGDPKGVQLTHRNILSNIDAALGIFEIGPEDSCLSHLPLAHIFERMAGYYLMLKSGSTIAYAEDIKTVADDMAAVKPTVCISVPRIFEKIYGGIQAKAVDAGGIKKALTFWAIDVANTAGALLVENKPLGWCLGLKHKIADTLVYSKVRGKFGGRIKFFVSGGAPLAPELSMFFRAVGIPVMEGYGLTETSPVIAANNFEHNKVGTVGIPFANIECRIAGDGEIMVRGPSVFKGYYRDEKTTREALEPDGWFHTGDIGEIDAEGFLRITDRKKDLIVTAGGKNIAPQKVENILKLDKYIAEAMLYGDRKKFVSAVIVPDFGWLERYAHYKKIPFSDHKELVSHQRIHDFVARRVAQIQAEKNLPSYESVKKFVLLDQEFSISEGEITPTLKIKRKHVIERYKDKLEALYEE